MPTRDMSRATSRRGRQAHARRVPTEEQQRLAALGAHSRYSARVVARRIADNFRYAAAVLELQGGAPEVIRLKTFTGRLPGIYPDES